MSAASGVAGGPGPDTAGVPGAPPRLSCLAPHMAMRFSPNGEVHACCVNDSYALGHVGRDRLEDVWAGARLAALRAAVDAGDGSLGCENCAVEHVRGRKAVTHAAVYEHWAHLTPAQWPVRLEFALTNTCNLTCVHCNGRLSSAIRSRREHLPPLPDHYDDRFFEEVVPFLRHVRVTSFLGGEPFLMRPVRRVWDLLLEHGRDDVEVHVTTNGTVWNERVEHYVRSLRMSVAVSVDGATAATFERIREGASYEEVCRNRDRFFELTREHGSSFTLNHCLLRDNVHELYDLLSDADARGMRVEVIPVWFPSRHSLFGEGPAELAEVLDRLRAQERAGGPLGRNADQWRTAIGHIESSLAELDASRGAAALASIPVAMPQRIPLLLRGSLRSQRELGGSAPLRVVVEQGVVAAVPDAGWAATLEPATWIGEPGDEVLGTVAAHLGPELRWDVRRLWARLAQVDLVVGGPAGALVRTHVVELEHDASRYELVVASPVPLAELEGAERRITHPLGSAPPSELAAAQPPRLPLAARFVLAEAIARQTELGGDAPLVVDVVDGVVVDVDAPPWAGRLGAEGWLGLPEHELPERLSASVGGAPRVQSRRICEQLTEIDLFVRTPSGSTRFRTHGLDRPGGGPGRRFVVTAPHPTVDEDAGVVGTA